MKDGVEVADFPDWLPVSDIADGHGSIRLESGESVTLFPTPLRVVPGRRFVCHAEKDGHALVAKLYNAGSRAARRHFVREVRGMQAMNSAGLPSPDIVYQGADQRGAIRLVLLRAIPDAQSLSGAVACSESNSQELLEMAIDLVLKQHHAGIVQRDIHLDNFLISRGDLYAIDGGGVVARHRKPVTRKEHIDNLALFCAQLPTSFDERCVGIRERLVAQQGLPWSVSNTGFSRAIHRQRAWRERKYLGKIYRTCSAFCLTRTGGRRIVSDRRRQSEMLRSVVQDPDGSMMPGEILKSGNTCTVWRVREGAQTLVVKRYNIKSAAHAVGRALRETRASISWRNAHRLRFHGVRCPQALALIEARPFGLRGRAWLIMEEVAGRHIGEILDDTGIDNDRRARLAREMARTMSGFQRLGISHGDMKASNFIVDANDGIQVLDLDAMHWHRPRRKVHTRQRRDLARLMRNWAPGTEAYEMMSLALKAEGLYESINQRNVTGGHHD